uniref:Uncharacterized protein n=1 Tax=Plectus sambesii TaxID=2011161 RepID=A0A914X197_9BILA
MSENEEHVKVSSVIEATVLDYREKVVILHGFSKDNVERDMARLKARKNSSNANGLSVTSKVHNSSSSAEEDEDDGDEAGGRVLSLRKKTPEKTWCVFMASANQKKPPQGKSQTFHLQTTIDAV